jgi:peroxiredoxin
MSIFSELISEFKLNGAHRKRLMAAQKKVDANAPRAGDMAPDFTLYDIEGKDSVTLSDFRGKKPVALVFGSFT